jgi:Xaa-Pro dipeptidase
MPSRLSKLSEVQKSTQVDAFLLTHLPTLRHLSGYFFNFEAGPSPFHLIPAALLAVPAGEAALLVADSEGGQLPGVDSKILIKTYASYVYESPFDFARQFQLRLQEVIDQFGLGKARLGIEGNAFPAVVYNSLKAAYPQIELVDVTKQIEKTRWIKDPDELEFIKGALRLCDVGQKALLENARPGMSELELFEKVRAAMDAAAGKRIPLMADLVSGPRTGETGGNPSHRRLGSGDLVMGDLTPCLDGYWGDSCNTIVMGNPTPIQQDIFRQVKEALDLGIQAVRPGVKALTVDRIMRDHLAGLGGYPHHGGHGVGVAYHEEPRIVPYSQLELTPNMVIALEPGVYNEKEGLRLEYVVRVTEDGCEVLSQFEHRLMAK